MSNPTGSFASPLIGTFFTPFQYQKQTTGQGQGVLLYLKKQQQVFIPDKCHIFSKDLTWEDAALSCQMRGGRLPSILWEEERKEINEAPEEETAWIRGRRLEQTWNDGSLWADIANLFGGSLNFEWFSILFTVLLIISEINLGSSPEVICQNNSLPAVAISHNYVDQSDKGTLCTSFLIICSS